MSKERDAGAIPTPVRLAELSFALANIAGKARWIGNHEQRLSGFDSKAAKEARADANTLVEAALALLALVPFGATPTAKAQLESPSSLSLPDTPRE